MLSHDALVHAGQRSMTVPPKLGRATLSWTHPVDSKCSPQKPQSLGATRPPTVLTVQTPRTSSTCQGLGSESGDVLIGPTHLRYRHAVPSSAQSLPGLGHSAHLGYHPRKSRSSMIDRAQAFGDKGKQPSMAGNSAGLASL